MTQGSGSVGLAFLAHEASVSRVPPKARILPLSPHVQAAKNQRVAERPEELLKPADFERIDALAQEVASRWWEHLANKPFTWMGSNVATFFSYGLRFSARDVIKTWRIILRAVEICPPTRIVTDVPPVSGTLPSYPYLSCMGSLLEAYAKTHGVPLTSLGPTAGRTPLRRVSPLVRAYSKAAARQAGRRLRAERPVVGVGPFPETFGPVARRLSEAGGSLVVVAPDRTPVRSDTRRGLYFAPVESFRNREDEREISAFVEQSAIAVPGTFPLEPVPGWDDQWWSSFAEEIRCRFQEHLADVASLLLAFHRGLDRASRLLLMETHSPLAAAAVHAGRACDIPVVVIQHGVIADATSYIETTADRLAAWGPVDADWFSRNLGPGVRVEPTGNPRYDALVSGDLVASHPVVEEAPRDVHVLLFASAPFGQLHAADSLWDHEELQTAVLETVSRVERTYLIFKRHPSEVAGPPCPIPSSAGARVREVIAGNTFELIRSSEVVLSAVSSVTLEAMHLSKPVIFVGPYDPRSPYHPPEDGGGLRAHSASGLANYVRRLLQDRDFRKEVLQGQEDYLRRTFAPLDGKASDRVLALMR